jgi:hypothetical protein
MSSSAAAGRGLVASAEVHACGDLADNDRGDDHEEEGHPLSTAMTFGRPSATAKPTQTEAIRTSPSASTAGSEPTTISADRRSSLRLAGLGGSARRLASVPHGVTGPQAGVVVLGELTYPPGVC